jgi:hypothetical protein
VIDKASFSNTDAKLSYNFFPRDDKPIQVAVS